MNAMTDTPVLLLLFNRPHLAVRLVDMLRPVRPARIFAAVDGPRSDREGEAALCRASLEALKAIDWPCRVETLVRKRNLGCGRAVAGAVDWFFGQVEEGIILEDDIIPSPGFFAYCREMLERYRHNERVMHVNGNNFYFADPSGPLNWFFSRYAHGWGWASWARAWRHFHLCPAQDGLRLDRTAPAASMPPETRSFWQSSLRRAEQTLHTWDYQWCLSIWQRNGLCVTPDRNLAANGGFDPDATHTSEDNISRHLCPRPFTTLGSASAREESGEPEEPGTLYDAYLNRFFYTTRPPTREDWLFEAERRHHAGEEGAFRHLYEAVVATYGTNTLPPYSAPRNAQEGDALLDEPAPPC